MHLLAWVFLVVAMTLAASPRAQGQRAAERTIDALPKSSWFLVPPRSSGAGKAGKPAGLVVVLPGGPGTREFLPWVESVLLAEAPADCVGVMLAAVKWSDDQTIVWPVKDGDGKGMQYTTSQYVRAVVAAVEAEYTIDPERRVVVGWSSSGMAIQPLLAEKDAPFARAYVAMSTWPRGLELAAVKGKRYLLDHSPADQQTAFSHCRKAYAELVKAGAIVRVTTYDGGHGWPERPEARLRDGLRWLLSKEPAGKPDWPPGPVASSPGKLVNLLVNPGFEDGLQGWNEVANSGRWRAEVVDDEKRTGKRALQLQKTGEAPLDLLRQEVELPPGSRVVASLQAKCKGVGNAFVNVLLYDDEDRVVHADGRLVAFPPDGKWQRFERDWPAKGASRAIVQIVMMHGGELWIDDVMLAVVK